MKEENDEMEVESVEFVGDELLETDIADEDFYEEEEETDDDFISSSKATSSSSIRITRSSSKNKLSSNLKDDSSLI
jgi:hypothetical protein